MHVKGLMGVVKSGLAIADFRSLHRQAKSVAASVRQCRNAQTPNHAPQSNGQQTSRHHIDSIAISLICRRIQWSHERERMQNTWPLSPD
jgi:hypothetical protein